MTASLHSKSRPRKRTAEERYRFLSGILESFAGTLELRELLRRISQATLDEFDADRVLLQVDGGSEFKAEFELACKERAIPLYVLPPRSPKLNGCVERANRTHQEEFYEGYDLAWTVTALRPDLLAWEKVYNTIRPHKSLGYLTPQEYVTQWRLASTRKEVVHSIT